MSQIYKWFKCSLKVVHNCVDYMWITCGLHSYLVLVNSLVADVICCIVMPSLNKVLYLVHTCRI